MSTENKALLQRWFDEVWNDGRAASIDEILSDTALIHGLGAGPIGPDGFKEFHAAYCNAFPDVDVHLDHVVAEGDVVAARWTASATHQGDGLGFAATGKPTRFTGMTFARVEHGKLVEGWNTFDQLGMLQQLGVVNLQS